MSACEILRRHHRSHKEIYFVMLLGESWFIKKKTFEPRLPKINPINHIEKFLQAVEKMEQSE